MTGEDDTPTNQGRWLNRMKSALSGTSKKLGGGLLNLSFKKIDASVLEELEDLLIASDVGIDMAAEVVGILRKKKLKSHETGDIKSVLLEEIVRILTPVAVPLDVNSGHHPHVILVVGVNGAGKTTTIGKLAAQMTAQGKKVILVAGDTFRAAAIEQLQVWGQRTQSHVIAKAQGADSASLAFEGCQKARSDGADVVIIDTAGRLHNKSDLMHELVKIIKVIRKFDPESPHDTILVLDATTGQNTMSQVEKFQDVADVSGLVMTKLDGTARGGILIQVAQKYSDIPIHAIGLGEGADDLRPFNPLEFSKAILGIESDKDI